MTNKTKKDKVDFKKAIEELEEINDWFSQEDIDLDEGLKKLKKGKDLIISCQKRLDEAETEFIDIKNELESLNQKEDLENAEDLELDL